MEVVWGGGCLGLALLLDDQSSPERSSMMIKKFADALSHKSSGHLSIELDGECWMGKFPAEVRLEVVRG